MFSLNSWYEARVITDLIRFPFESNKKVEEFENINLALKSYIHVEEKKQNK